MFNWIRWLRGAPRFLSGSLLLGLGTLAVLAFVHGKQEACIRWWGMFLQLVGIATVVLDLRDKQHHFNRAGMRKAIRDWFAHRPGKGVTLEAAAVSEMAAIGQTARAVVRTPVNAGDPVATQLAAIQRNMGRMDEELRQAETEIDREIRERAASVSGEAAARAAAMQEMRRELEAVTAGSVSVSMFGVLWLAAGVILSSTSVELAGWIGKAAKWAGLTW